MWSENLARQPCLLLTRPDDDGRVIHATLARPRAPLPPPVAPLPPLGMVEAAAPPRRAPARRARAPLHAGPAGGRHRYRSSAARDRQRSRSRTTTSRSDERRHRHHRRGGRRERRHRRPHREYSPDPARRPTESLPPIFWRLKARASMYTSLNYCMQTSRRLAWPGPAGTNALT